MLTTQSQLKITKENRDYFFTCSPDSPITEVQAVLYEMLAFCDFVLKSAEEKEKQDEKLNEMPDTEQTL